MRGVTLTDLSQDASVASGARNDAAPAFVQLGVMGADVVAHISETKERLTAELKDEIKGQTSEKSV